MPRGIDQSRLRNCVWASSMDLSDASSIPWIPPVSSLNGRVDEPSGSRGICFVPFVPFVAFCWILFRSVSTSPTNQQAPFDSLDSNRFRSHDSTLLPNTDHSHEINERPVWNPLTVFRIHDNAPTHVAAAFRPGIPSPTPVARDLGLPRAERAADHGRSPRTRPPGGG